MSRHSLPLLQAKVQMDAFIDLHSGGINTCQKKCLNPTGVELTDKEKLCTDSCLSKFFEANMLVGELAQDHILEKQKELEKIQKMVQ
ncbi:hypothetical protein HK103_005365 [Boothiomyces macroporosus]|uniref:Mitochondrial import inner membrane translocase subunit n=1 Tax=Boothiomyces macroporosus TaxID=261099 RepID=A0AAD5UNP2_9FUNG|nr:hypothetical protein HK103_005365 [Boothiomyces macroporosus]